jgi:hypothetical protein
MGCFLFMGILVNCVYSRANLASAGRIKSNRIAFAGLAIGLGSIPVKV